jgi:hypothetical protein
MHPSLARLLSWHIRRSCKTGHGWVEPTMVRASRKLRFTALGIQNALIFMIEARVVTVCQRPG